jgi:hypothetical protein
VDVANVEDAWQKLFDENKTYEEADLNKQGWLNIYEISERFNLSPSGARDKLRRIKAEKKMFPVYRGGATRMVSFYSVK